MWRNQNKQSSEDFFLAEFQKFFNVYDTYIVILDDIKKLKKNNTI